MSEAVRLFARKGYDGASVREIVERAGVTKPMLYYHFGSKEGLCEAILQDGTTRLEEALARPNARRGAVGRLTELIYRKFKFCTENHDLTRFVYSLLLGAPAPGAEQAVERFCSIVREALAGEIESLVTSGELAGKSAEDMVWVSMAAVNACIMAQLRAGVDDVLTRKLARDRMELLCNTVGRKGRFR